MNIDYNDPRFQQVNQEKQTALNEVNNTYNNMINQADKYYNDLSKAYEDYGNKQQELQQQRTDFTVDQINQNKEWAKKDYEKEQKGAYQDYVNQVNPYGVNAEQMAQNGLLGTGYSESSKVSMYNAYQNRVATARESYNRSVVEYDNQIKDAQLANSEALAQLAFDSLKAKLEYSLQGFQYKNDLIQTQLQQKQNTEDRYYTKWQNVLDQLNKEKAFEYQKERDRIADQQWQKQYNLSAQKIAQENQIYKFIQEQEKNSKKYEDTGFELSGYSILKSGDKYYYQKPNGEYQELPVYGVADKALTLNDGTVLVKK